MRTVKFKVVGTKWDCTYSTTFTYDIANFDNYKDAEEFALNYSGEEESVQIEKTFEKRLIFTEEQ